MIAAIAIIVSVAVFSLVEGLFLLAEEWFGEETRALRTRMKALIDTPPKPDRNDTEGGWDND